jgi:hypothetical protein
MLRALGNVWLALKPLNIPMALMGGIALATWKYVRATRDIDLLLGMAEDREERLVEVLKACGCRPKHSPPIVRLGQLDLVQLVYEPPETFMDLQIDLLLAKSDYHRKALDRRVPIRLADLDIEIDVLACEDLILHKLLAERIVDLADTAALMRANRESLDYAYLLNWIENLGLWPPFRQAWHAAWPDEPLPGRGAGHC